MITKDKDVTFHGSKTIRSIEFSGPEELFRDSVSPPRKVVGEIKEESRLNLQDSGGDIILKDTIKGICVGYDASMDKLHDVIRIETEAETYYVRL